MSNGRTIGAVIFDMDGVLTDSEPLINAAAVAMFKEKGLEVRPEDFIPFVGTGENRYIGGVAEKYGFSVDIAEAKKRTYEVYLELAPARLTAFPGAVELVRRCRQAGLKVALASSADLIKINANLRKIGLPPEEWDAVVHGEEVEHKKPAPDIFLTAARKLGFEPAQCVVVEDAVNGVEAAKAAPMRCVAVAHSFPAEKLAQADLVRSGISEVTIEDLLGPAPSGTLPPLTADAPPPSPSPATPWGLWATLGLGCAALLVTVFAQNVGAGVAYAVTRLRGHDIPVSEIGSNGLILSIGSLCGAPVAVLLSWLFARMRKGMRARDYLALRRVPGSAVWRWTIWFLLFLVLCDALTAALGRPVVPDSMVRFYETAVSVPLLLLAILVVAPVSEEILFRGFLYAGLEQSPVGWVGATLISSFLWASIHLQYDLYGIVMVFAGGLFLGAVRWMTQSVYATILLHAVMNLLATIELVVRVRCY